MVVTSRIIRGSRRREPDPMAPRPKFQSRNPNSPGPSGRAAIQPLIPGRAASAAASRPFIKVFEAWLTGVGFSVYQYQVLLPYSNEPIGPGPHPFSQGSLLPNTVTRR